MKTIEIDKILQASGDPALAESQWRSLEPLLSRLSWKQAGVIPLLKLLGNSRFLVEYLTKHPSALRELVSSLPKPKGLEKMILDLRLLFAKNFTGAPPSAQKILRNYKYRETARIAVRDLAGLAPFEEIGRELADLASASVEFAKRAAVHFHASPRASIPPFAVIGLGKLGGEDLNFSSDIDILYLYDAEEPERLPRRRDFEFFVRIAETTTRILQERTEDGIGFRVDLNLRPQGRSGPLVNSLEALTLYYEISGAPWERAAWIKGRPIAGDRRLGERVLKAVEPFVYRKTMDLSAISELKKMKGKIEEELKKSKKGGFHVKLGRGGIREIEFFAQAFQLVYGGKEPRLRERNTLKALEALKELGRAPAEEIDRLKEGYLLLRRIENRLQMLDERQIHTLPTERSELLALARRTGFSDPEGFLEAIREKTGFVAACFERLAT
jgi:glutamate-ammonia-ligase adenylyltransferase